MQLIFGRENAEKLREKYTVLDLEEVEKEGVKIEVFCLIPAEKIGLGQIADLDNWVKLHNDFLNGYHTEQYDYCLQCMEHLRGKFGGEVDTFYDEIERRISEKQQTE